MYVYIYTYITYICMYIYTHIIYMYVYIYTYNIYVCITGSLCCTLETNTTWSINYTSIKNIQLALN